ncbi:hypothetical protein HDU86_008272 [Geranomyces michiganensis]|nr:hypothetical protein HDU86_008272 [Geranomyces michiganensis]
MPDRKTINAEDARPEDQPAISSDTTSAKPPDSSEDPSATSNLPSRAGKHWRRKERWDETVERRAQNLEPRTQLVCVVRSAEGKTELVYTDDYSAALIWLLGIKEQRGGAPASLSDEAKDEWNNILRPPPKDGDGVKLGAQAENDSQSEGARAYFTKLYEPHRRFVQRWGDGWSPSNGSHYTLMNTFGRKLANGEPVSIISQIFDKWREWCSRK